MCFAKAKQPSYEPSSACLLRGLHPCRSLCSSVTLLGCELVQMALNKEGLRQQTLRKSSQGAFLAQQWQRNPFFVVPKIPMSSQLLRLCLSETARKLLAGLVIDEALMG